MSDNAAQMPKWRLLPLMGRVWGPEIAYLRHSYRKKLLMFQTAYTHENLPKVRYLDPFHDVSIRNPNGFRYNAVLMPKMPTFTPYGDPNTRIFVNHIGKSYQGFEFLILLKTFPE